MAMPSEARVSVEVIATSNHFTEPLSVTHTSIHRRAINCRDRVSTSDSQLPCPPNGTTAVEALRGKVGHDVEVARRTKATARQD